MTLANRRGVSLSGPDYYPTPAWAVRALLEQESFPGVVAEPCCGEGHMSRALEAGKLIVQSSDLYDHGYGKVGVDARDIESVDHIVTNPPYNIASELLPVFLQKASCKVALLLRLSFLESKKRHPLFQEHPLARLYIFSERVSFAPAGEIVKGGGTISHGWFIWDRSHTSATELRWLGLGHKTSGMS